MTRPTTGERTPAAGGDGAPGGRGTAHGAGHLVTMANRIGDFFRHQGDEPTARQGIAAHLHHFWAPSMRRDLIERMDRAPGSTIDGATLDPLVRAALDEHRGVLLSPRGRRVPGEDALLESPPGGGDAG